MTTTAAARDRSCAWIPKKKTRVSCKSQKTSQGDKSCCGLRKDLKGCQSLRAVVGVHRGWEKGSFLQSFIQGLHFNVQVAQLHYFSYSGQAFLTIRRKHQHVTKRFISLKAWAWSLFNLSSGVQYLREENCFQLLRPHRLRNPLLRLQIAVCRLFFFPMLLPLWRPKVCRFFFSHT